MKRSMRIQSRVIRNFLLVVVSIYLIIAARNQPVPNRSGDLTTPAATQAVASASAGIYPVAHIVDGDTVDVTVDGRKTRIRLIGVDTPELVDPRKPVQCFAREASDYTKHILEGKTVRLESDPTQGDTDKYGRLLRYVYLEDGTFVNRELIAGGYAHEYTYDIPYRYQDEFRREETQAREGKRGLWDPSVCP